MWQGNRPCGPALHTWCRDFLSLDPCPIGKEVTRGVGGLTLNSTPRSADCWSKSRTRDSSPQTAMSNDPDLPSKQEYRAWGWEWVFSSF